MTNKQLVKQLDSKKKKLAKLRDELRVLVDEASEMEGCIATAIDDIERAADALSQLV